MQFVVGHCDAVGGTGAGQADQVLGADVGGEDGGPDDEPAEVPARKEVIVCSVLALQDDPPGNAKQYGKVNPYNHPVPPSKCRRAEDLRCRHRKPFLTDRV
ncbi:MAG: hypothetical protein ACYST6_06375 [Planctomycetota bacterium]